MKIAILGAMQEEIEPILEVLNKKDGYTVVEHAGNNFYVSKYAGHELVIAWSKIGKVNAAITATVLLEKFECKILLFTGVAGALNHLLKINDIVYATSTVQHDIDITNFGHPFGYVPGIEVFTPTDSRLNEIAVNLAASMNLNLVGGIIASGDQFICDSDKKNWLIQTFNADAVEMEGAAVGQVCSFYKVPFFLMRAISDEAGNKATIDFDDFLHESAKSSANFILRMVKNI